MCTLLEPMHSAVEKGLEIEKVARVDAVGSRQDREPTLNLGMPASSDHESYHPSRKANGVSTTNLILSAHVGQNADVFPQILKLHVPLESKVADVTYGKGAFWKKVPRTSYEVFATDLKTGTDCRSLPYDDDSMDCVVLDPPYMEGLFRRDENHMAGGGSHGAFRSHYSDGQATPATEGQPKWHDAVLAFYFQAAEEAARVLKNYGVFIVKCQDEVSANRQRLTHVELINEFESRGFYAKDLFIVVRANKPGVSRLLKQEHARKNHSYFLVLIKRDPEYPKRIRPPKRQR